MSVKLACVYCDHTRVYKMPSKIQKDEQEIFLRTKLHKLILYIHRTDTSFTLRNSSLYIADLSSLKLLELYNTNIELETGFFNRTSNLETLELNKLWKNEFQDLGPKVFSGLKTLLSLELNENDLRTLPADVFKVRCMFNIPKVNLENNFHSHES